MSQINKAIKHLDNAIFDTDLKIEELEQKLNQLEENRELDDTLRQHIIKLIKEQGAKKRDLQNALKLLYYWE